MGAELLIGAAIALGSTWFGSRLAGRQAAALEDRRERADEQRRKVQVKAAARLVFADLGLTAVQADGAARNLALVGLRAIPRDAWRQHGLLLSSELPPDARDVVIEATGRCAAVAELVAGAHLGLTGIEDHPEAIESVTTLGRMCRDAQRGLGPIAYPDESWAVAPEPTRTT